MTTILTLCAALLASSPSNHDPTVLVVVGAEGTAEYGEQFKEWADHWKTAAEKGGARYVSIQTGEGDDESARDALKKRLTAEQSASSGTLWLVLIGHGTFDGKVAKFNLRGPDVSAAELAEWLEPIERPIAVVNCASSSGPFINQLSKPNRVIVTAAKSGYEYNYARFGGAVATAIADESADLDKDEQVSLLEAFLAAAARTEEFYASDGRLATEHALLDDNADGLGTPASWFRGVRAVRTAQDGAAPDGLRANQLHLIPSNQERGMPAEMRARRDELEQKIEQLRQAKGRMAEDDYYEALEPHLLNLARLYQSLENAQSQPGQSPKDVETSEGSLGEYISPEPSFN